MKTFKQYMEEMQNSTFQRIMVALHKFIENRQGLLQDIEIRFNPSKLGGAFGELTFEGADKPALEDATRRVEELAVKIDGNAGSNLYDALSNLTHMADDLDGIRDLHRALSWLPEIDKIRSSRS